MQTVMTTNNAYDAILLVDSNDVVKSAWTADSGVIANYLADGANAANWDEGSFTGFADECATIADYGTECGRNGVISPERLAFWGR